MCSWSCKLPMKTYSRRKLVKLKELIGICRLCLSSDGDRRLIFTEVEDIPLTVKIMTCTSVQVSEGDGMPSEICHKCVHQLESSYKFRQKCEEADLKLRRLLTAAKDVETNQQEFHESDFITVKNNLYKLQNSETVEKSSTFDYIPLSHSNSELLTADTSVASKTHCPDSSESVKIDCKSSSSLICDLSDLLIQNVHEVLCNTSKGEVTAPEHTLETTQKLLKDSWNKRDNLRGNKGLPRVGRMNSTLSPLGSEKNLQNSLELPESLQSADKTGNQSFTFSPTMNNKHTECLAVKKQYFDSDTRDLGNENHHSSVTDQCGAVSDCKLIFICDKCPKRFSKRLDLKRHTSVHNQQRGFVCEICEKWCPNQTNFKRHERTHTGERPFSCKYCSKSFSQSAILNRHLMIHTGEKPFQCDTCGKKFTQKESLKVHSRQHSTGGDCMTYHYKCSFCVKSFCHQSGLSRHLVTHTGKTFSCNLCPKTFTDPSSLRRHLKRHFEIKS